MRQIIALAVFMGLIAVSAPTAAFAGTSAEKQCSKLKDQVSKRAAALAKVKNLKDGPKKVKLVRRATAALDQAGLKHKRMCELLVCAQLPMPKCAAELCAQVMPAPKTYSSLAAAKEDNAKLLYYGACQR